MINPTSPAIVPAAIIGWCMLVMFCAGCGDRLPRQAPTEQQAPPPFAPWAAVPLPDQLPAAEWEPLWNPSTYDRRLNAIVEGPNLVQDPNFDDLDRHWAVKFFGPVRTQAVELVEVILPDGRTARALQVSTDQRTEITMRRTVVLPSDFPRAGYRVALWLKTEGAADDAAAGVYGFDATGMMAAWMLKGGGASDAPSWFARLKPDITDWRRVCGYLIPASERHDWSDPADTTERNLQASLRLHQISLFVTAQAQGDGIVTVSMALPSIEAVRFEPFSASDR